MCGGQPVRWIHARTYGAKKPPAPATSGAVKGMVGDSAHIALPSDCFSQATVSTRSKRPEATCDTAASAVEAPTDPAVWMRIIGLR